MQSKLTVTKMKDGERLNDLHFSLTKEHLGFDEDGDAISSLVATYEAATLPGKVVQLSDADWRRVQDAVSRGHWRKDHQTKDAWVGNAFAGALNMDLADKLQINALIEQAIAEGVLAIEEKKVGRRRNTVKFVIVGHWIEP